MDNNEKNETSGEELAPIVSDNEAGLVPHARKTDVVTQAGGSLKPDHIQGADLENAFAFDGTINFVRIALNIVTVVAILLFGGVIGKKLTEMRRQPPKKPPVVRTLKVQAMDVVMGSHTVTLIGQGTAAAKSELNIVPEVMGKLVYVHPEFREGGFVKKGEILFKIDPSDLSEQKNQILAGIAAYESDIDFQISQRASLKREVAEAKKTWEVSHEETERIRRLVEQKAASDAELNRMLLSERGSLERIESYETRIGLIEPTIKKLESAINGQKAQLAKLQLSLGRTVYRAPFTGLVSGAGYEKGQFIAAGQVVARLQDDNTYTVPVPISVSDFQMLGIRKDSEALAKNPEPVDVRWKDSTGRETAKFPGRIVRLGSQLDPITRLLNVIVEVRKEDMGGEFKLLPGMYVEVAFTGQTLENVVKIPRRALREGNMVYLVKDGAFAMQEAEVWGRTGDEFIISGGLNNEDTVITSVVDEPTPGLPVTVISGSE